MNENKEMLERASDFVMRRHETHLTTAELCAAFAAAELARRNDWVEIKGEADLPQEEGIYWWQPRNGEQPYRTGFSTSRFDRQVSARDFIAWRYAEPEPEPFRRSENDG